MTTTKESKHIDLLLTIIPGLFIIGIGILEINFPHAMDGSDDGYTGTGKGGFILLLLELFLMLTWGKIEGIFLISLGTILIIVCSSFNSNSEFDSKTGKAIAQTAKFVWKRRNKIPVEEQKQILNVAKKLSEPKTRELINQTATNIAQQYSQKNNTLSQDEQAVSKIETNKPIEELVIAPEVTDNEKIEVGNDAKEKSKTRKIIDQVANELAKNYLEQETKNIQEMVNISDSKNSEAITQTVKAIAKAYIQEISETEEAEKTEEKSGKRSRRLGKTTRSLAKNYLEQQ